ncbi:hypothetical protein QE386_000137 [Pseudoxanthomonas winnipegensis]|nr:hypothetical protein [Pseudoxanthomonas winnipegensis]
MVTTGPPSARAARTRAFQRGDQALLRHRQPQSGQQMIGGLLVAGQLDRQMRRAPGQRGLDALLIVAVAELDQRMGVQPQPRNAARLRRRDQRGGGRAQCAPLGIEDVVDLGRVPGPAIVQRHVAAQGRGQQRGEQAQGQLAGGQALFALGVGVDHPLQARRRVLAEQSGAEAYVLAGHGLHRQRHVLQDLAQRQAIARAQAMGEVAVRGQAGQGGQQRLGEGRSQPAAGPFAQIARVQVKPYHRLVRVDRGAQIDRAFDDAQGPAHVGSRASVPGEAVRVARL